MVHLVGIGVREFSVGRLAGCRILFAESTLAALRLGLRMNLKMQTHGKNTGKKSAPPKTHHESHSSPATAFNLRRHVRKHVTRVSSYCPASIDPGVWKTASYSSRNQ